MYNNKLKSIAELDGLLNSDLYSFCENLSAHHAIVELLYYCKTKLICLCNLSIVIYNHVFINSLNCFQEYF